MLLYRCVSATVFCENTNIINDTYKVEPNNKWGDKHKKGLRNVCSECQRPKKISIYKTH